MRDLSESVSLVRSPRSITRIAIPILLLAILLPLSAPAEVFQVTDIVVAIPAPQGSLARTNSQLLPPEILSAKNH